MEKALRKLWARSKNNKILKYLDGINKAHVCMLHYLAYVPGKTS
jgi:hypothetical protein